MRNAKVRKRLLLCGSLVVSGLSAHGALAQPLVFLTCTFANGAVARIKIDPNGKKADFLNGGRFVLEVSEGFYTLTTTFDFGASGGGVVDLETKIDRRSQQLKNSIAGRNKGNFAQYPLSGTCSNDHPWPGAVS